MNVNDYLAKCLELSERAALSDHEMRDCITALPKVCEALKLCMKAFDDIDEQKQLAGVHDNLTALAFASRLALCQIAKDEALQKLSKLFDDADGG